MEEIRRKKKIIKALYFLLTGLFSIEVLSRNIMEYAVGIMITGLFCIFLDYIVSKIAFGIVGWLIHIFQYNRNEASEAH